MIIGVPRERKTLEKRVALTPSGARQLKLHGHEVLVEKDAGAGSFFADEGYEKAGATVVETLEEIWTRAELVVKVKEPHETEFQYFRPGLAVFDFLHLASLPDVADALLKSKVTGIAYELVKGQGGGFPLLEPMSEIAGKLAIMNGSYFMLSQNGGRGVFLGGAIGVPRGKVVILGAGVAGTNACEIAVGLGASVTVMDINHDSLKRIKVQFGNRVNTLYSSDVAISEELRRAELAVGAVLVPGASAPKIISREIIRSMTPGAVFVDISIDQGGCAETIRPTSLDNPVYEEEGVLHYGVCNMPAQVARTSTMALTSATLPYIIRLADQGIEQSLKNDKVLRDALNTFDGNITNEAVAISLGKKCSLAF